MLRTRRLGRGIVSVAALALCTSAVIVGASSFASSNADFTGAWSLVDHVVSGPEQGQDYPWSGTWTQTGTQLTGTGTYGITGSVSGSTATFTTTTGGSYVATFHLTMSADGKSLSGTATDNGGRSFTVTGSGNGKPPTTTPPSTPPKLPAIDPRKATGRMQSVAGSNLTVIRDGKRYTATTDSLLQVGDILETGKDTVAEIEFARGGRVGINRNSQVKIAGDLDVESSQIGPREVILNKGRMWVNERARPSRGSTSGLPPGLLEITTNGGVTGIRG